MSKPEIFITFRVTQDEKDLLRKYCEQESRNQTEILRQLIRSLKRRLKTDGYFSTRVRFHLSTKVTELSSSRLTL